MTVVQFAFLFFIATVNFMVGVGAAVYLGKAPRDLRFVAPLREAMRFRIARNDTAKASPTVAAASELPAVDPPPVASDPAPGSDPAPATVRPASSELRQDTSKPAAVADPVEETAEAKLAPPSPVSEAPSAPAPPPQMDLEELIIDMAAQEEHLRQVVQAATADQRGEFVWEELLSDVNEDVQKLLRYFNEARYLVEQQEREFATETRQTCLDELDAHWHAINQQSMQLLVISSEPDPPDTARHNLAAICEAILQACRDTRQSCAAYMAHVSLERPLVSP